jgi:uncharacterized membrane protein YccC
LRADATRAARAMVAFAVPWLVCHELQRPAEALFISMTAMNLSLPDLRGAYRVRIGILAAMILVAVGSAWLGVWCAPHPLGAVLAMGAVAVLGAVWRHLSADYGPSMAVSSALLFLLGLSQSGGWRDGMDLAALAGLGGAFAALLHACHWWFRPQHGLRYSVAETCVAASDLVAAMRPGSATDPFARSQTIAKREGELRAALDRTFVILGAAKSPQQAALLAHLEEVRREVVHLAMRMIALNTSLEPILEHPDAERFLPVVDSVLKALSDAARSAAITLIMHRAENFAASDVRLRRCEHLIKTLDERLAAVPAADVAVCQVRVALTQVEQELPRLRQVLRQTVDYAVPLRFLSAGLPDLSARSVQSLGAWIRPAARLDPVLIRHGARMAVFTMIAVALYKYFDLSRGYWIAFTIMVVLQPDYGSTRQRAGARIAGTVGGIVLAGVLLWIQPSPLVVDALASAMAFLFAYHLRRNYGLAIFFVTINLVLVTDTLTPVRHDFMMERVLATLLGGGLALVAARIFWPIWEGRNFPALLAAAIRANRAFLLALSPWLGLPMGDVPELLMAKRRAENANRVVAASVERLLGEPAGLRENPERAAALATYNQRVTRALTVLAVQLPAAAAQNDSATSARVERLSAVLEHLAQVVEQGLDEARVALVTTELLSLESDFTATSNSPLGRPSVQAPSVSLTQVQLAKTIAEIRAMTLALSPAPAAAD